MSSTTQDGPKTACHFESPELTTCHFESHKFYPFETPENLTALREKVSLKTGLPVGEFFLEFVEQITGETYLIGDDEDYDAAKKKGTTTDPHKSLIVTACRRPVVPSSSGGVAASSAGVQALTLDQQVGFPAIIKNLIPWLGRVSVIEDVSPAFSKLLAAVTSVLSNNDPFPENGVLLNPEGSFPFNPPLRTKYLIRKSHLQVLEDLRLHAPSKRTVVTGCSGIGKSTATILLVIHRLMSPKPHTTAATTSSSSTSPTASTVSGDTTRPLVILLSHTKMYYVFVRDQSLRDDANPLGTRAYQVCMEKFENCPPIVDEESGTLVVEEWSLVDGTGGENEDRIVWKDRHGILFASPGITAIPRTQTWKTSRPVVLPPWTIGELKEIRGE
eukprot:TRINITY_DN2821_c0_g2_i7.p1 TRINITY_DN2821_c0_g2~~TRINITY_DN2821_c0_g2_i7.p1  ORF type:complete len:434 (-),score=38.37 TRINITY_DN2821_c0_g2_i7:1411-2571(-)